MGKQVTYEQARTLLLERLSPLGTERVTLARCEGRVLAEDIAATESIPSFDRSSYDGYAFRSADVAGATPDAPVTLAVLEEIPAGVVPTLSVSKGTAARVMTGAPIPQGADAVVMFEKQNLPPKLSRSPMLQPPAAILSGLGRTYSGGRYSPGRACGLTRDLPGPWPL